MAEFDEDKYIVIPTKYVERLGEVGQELLNEVLTRINRRRLEDGKSDDPKYIVCKQSEPYADTIKNIILSHEANKDNSLPERYILVQTNPDYAVNKDNGWLYFRHPGNRWSSCRKATDAEIMQAEDQELYNIVLDGKGKG